MMQKEIADDLSALLEEQLREDRLWTVDPAELSLAGRWPAASVCQRDELVSLKLKHDPRELLFSTTKVTYGSKQ